MLGLRTGAGGILTMYLIATLVSLPVSATVVSLEETFEQSVSSGIGGHTLLVEELTATWCPTCAEIDPQLKQVADSHGSRIALIALHPTDGEDAFQPPASLHRIERLQTVHEDLTSTPTFIVEGGELRVGYDAWVDVQRDILDNELQRSSTTKLAFEVIRNGTGMNVAMSHFETDQTNGTQLTFLLLEHGKSMPSDAVNPGLEVRDRVAVGLVECDLSTHTITEILGPVSTNTSCLNDFSFSFETMDSWSVVLIHEATTDSIANGTEPLSLGVIEMAYRERIEPVTNSLGTALIVLCALLSMVAIYRKK